MDGMGLVADRHETVSEGPDDSSTRLPLELYGHLAAALRFLLTDATYAQLETLTSKRSMHTLALTFTIGVRRLPSAACPSAKLQGAEAIVDQYIVFQSRQMAAC